ncbi:unnamed protein product, partial [Urochloa humidicola]
GRRSPALPHPPPPPAPRPRPLLPPPPPPLPRRHLAPPEPHHRHPPSPPAPGSAPPAALLAAEGASLAPRREHRSPGSLSTPTSPAAAGGLSEAEDAVLRRALEVRRAVAGEALVAALSGGKVGGL